MSDSTITIYTDGACKGNPGAGGWAAVLSYRGNTRELSGGDDDTTNNRMEMTAVICALRALKRPRCRICLYTDSQYVMRGMNEWLPGWKKRNFRAAGGKPVKNIDLWQELEALAEPHDIQWHWVRGHSGDAGNERADELAQAQAQARRERLAGGGAGAVAVDAMESGE